MPTPPTGARPYIDGDTYIPALMGQVTNRIASGASQMYIRHFGVGINEWRILSVLSNTPHSNAGHICATVDMHKAVASRSVRSMQDKGLVVITLKGGQRLMALTGAGQALHDRIAKIAFGRENLLLSGFSGAERQALIGYLRRMVANVPGVNAWDPFATPAAAPVRKVRAQHRPD
jgi:DNA-binding MarR family transcriptional regulator